jgi:hypothetical protein
MLQVDHINNTALYGFHPDFVRHEMDETPAHDENIETKLVFGDLREIWTEIFLVWVLVLTVWMIAVPVVRYL